MRHVHSVRLSAVTSSFVWECNYMHTSLTDPELLEDVVVIYSMIFRLSYSTEYTHTRRLTTLL